MTNLRRIFFEPWGLGDALVAAAVAREIPECSALACKNRWHPILRAVLPESMGMMPLELPYTLRDKKSAWQRGELPPIHGEPCEVLSIRGDFRDWLAAKHLFPQGRTRMNGWLQFAPHYSLLLDLPFAIGVLPVRNRYRAWAELAGFPFGRLERTYRTLQARAPKSGDVLIHIGAYRRSRQYPHVGELRKALARRGHKTMLLSGPDDPLPAGINKADVNRALDLELVDSLRRAKYVITNDSAAMHLAALLGCRTIVIARVTNIFEWLPPATQFVASPKMPRGYRMDRRYNSDEVLTDWPTAEQIADAIGAEIVNSQEPMV
jgi:hypothetical protein